MPTVTAGADNLQHPDASDGTLDKERRYTVFAQADRRSRWC
jgi:hypothetical protein